MTAPSIITWRVRLLPGHPDARSLLAAHGLTGTNRAPFPHTGFSGATLTRLVREDGASFVLKQTSIARDWIMRATNDAQCRERHVDEALLPAGVRSPLLGWAPDGDGFALLMRDISGDLLPAGTVAEERLDVVLRRMAHLHATPVPATVPWCALDKRLTLLTPDGARLAASYGAPVAHDLTNGWHLFERFAPPRAASLISDLSHEPAPLLDALSRLPSAFLHGDLKFDNIGIDADERVWLIDWAMTLVAAPAVELGWFLAINSTRMTATLDEVMDRYAEHAAMDRAHIARHAAFTALCGLLLRGWRKALDADAGEPAELHWWCERAADAERFLR